MISEINVVHQLGLHNKIERESGGVSSVLTKKEILEMMKIEVIPVFGCTEPACIALEAASARVF